MVAWMDDAALARTLATREATYFRGPATSSGSRAPLPGTPSTYMRCGWTATVTRCCWTSIRPAAPVTPETAVASTLTCCSVPQIDSPAAAGRYAGRL